MPVPKKPNGNLHYKGSKQNNVLEVPNTLNEQEKIEGWTLIFDGKTTNGWKGLGIDSFPSSRWEIADNSLHCIPSENPEKDKEMDILFDKIYGDFELDMEWKSVENAWGGIYFFAKDAQVNGRCFPSLKMQIGDQYNNSLDPTHSSGALYDLLSPGMNHFAFDEWNHIRILSCNGQITFYQNSEKILEFDLNSAQWSEKIKKSRFKGNKDYLIPGGEEHTGYIGLQDGKTSVWYRNIKIRAVD